MKDMTDLLEEIECVRGWWYFVVDGDDIGNEAALPLLRDKERDAQRISKKIHEGQKVIERWVDEQGGELILEGGDNAVFKLQCDPSDDEELGEIIEDVELLRESYKAQTDFTLSVGIGYSPSSANKALLVAKERGKDRTVTYDVSVEEEYQEILERIKGDEDGLEKRRDQVLIENKSRYKPSRSAADTASKALKMYRDSESKAEWPKSKFLYRTAEKIARRKSFSRSSAERLASLMRRYGRRKFKSSDRAVRLLGGADTSKSLSKFFTEESE